MDEKTMARLKAKTKEADHYATLSLASGSVVDEGDESSQTVFSYSRLAALDVARSGYLGEYAEACANSRDVRKQREVSDYLAGPERARDKGIVVIVDLKENQLGKAEFFSRRELGAAAIRADTSMTERAAELEWMKREAEEETGCKRDDSNRSRKRRWERAYNALRARDSR